ncbi:MAG: hypothetical protein LBJ67_00870 [Planctomycetaceae bacterium]|jgi:hypothetical protein|nr:hypothetical protein [Planctomycetaceae bacterium]
MLLKFRILITLAVIYAVFFSAVMPMGICRCDGCSCENNVFQEKNAEKYNEKINPCCSRFGHSCCCGKKTESQSLPQIDSMSSSCCQKKSDKNNSYSSLTEVGCRCGKIIQTVIALPDIVSPIKKTHNNFYGIIVLVFGFDTNSIHSAALHFLKHSPPEATHVPLRVLLCVFLI